MPSDAKQIALDSYITRVQGMAGEAFAKARKAEALAQQKQRELSEIAQGSVASARKVFGGRRHR